jgi:hypothetical protein
LSSHDSRASHEVIAALISPERMEPFRRLAQGRDLQALDVYVVNLNASAALLRLIAIAEVILRNALDRRLTERFGSHAHWSEGLTGVLRPRAVADIDSAKRRISIAGVTLSPQQLTAHLGLSFWTYLLSKPYKDSLWIPTLRHAFPHLTPRSRDVVYRQARRMLALRNRVAHHEKVLTEKPEEEALGILDLLSWIDGDAAGWAAEVCASPIPGLDLPASRWWA